MVEANAKARERMIGLQPTLTANDALVRNLEIGRIEGLKLVPHIVLTAATTARDTYQRLLDVEQGVTS